MGYTNASFELITPYLKGVKSICDLGSQQHHEKIGLPYMRDVFRKYEYMSIDLNGEADAKRWDLSEPLKTNKTFDLVTDLGTSEHVKDFFQAMGNVNKLTRVGGLMFHENPKVGNWPLHGYHYRDQDFYKQLAEIANYEILHLDEWPACWNTTDGWIIRAIMRKKSNDILVREAFPKTYSE